MLWRLLDTCKSMQALGTGLASELEQAGTEARSDARLLRERIAAGELPYANSEVCPVDSPYGMQVRTWGKPPLVVEFAKDALPMYRELDDYGSVATEWALQLGFRARTLLV